MASSDDRERVRQATDFVTLVGETVVLRQRSSGDFWGCCPFHDEKTPSFHVRQDTGLWFCFGCDEGGDVFSYVQKRDNVGFREALHFLADRAGIELTDDGRYGGGPKKNRLVACLEEAMGYFCTQLMRGRGAGCDQARAYLGARNMGSKVAKTWQLGFAPGNGQLVQSLMRKGYTKQELLAADLAVERGGRLHDRFFNRVMFPIANEQGQIIGFGGRVMDDSKPKYLNSKDSPVWHKSKNLYALDHAKEAIVAKQQVIVVEGYTDAIALHEAGFSNVVAVLGTALTLDHIRMLSRYKPSSIVMMLDGDAAGQRAAEKTVRFVDKTEARLLSVVLPGGKDPAEFIAAEGTEALRERLQAARPLVDFVLDTAFKSTEGASDGAQAQTFDHIARVLAPLKRSMVVDRYITQVADFFGTTSERVRAAIEAAEPLETDRERRTSLPASEPASRYDAAPPAPQHWQTKAPYTAPSKRQRFERELLALLATDSELRARSAQKLMDLEWSSEAVQTVAWALLAAPQESTPAELVALAETLMPGSQMLLAAAPAQDEGATAQDEHVEFLVANINLYAAKEQLNRIRVRIDSAPLNEQRTLLISAQELQKRVQKLDSELKSGRWHVNGQAS